MRVLLEYEKAFWNDTSISILEDAGFILQINDGEVVGVGYASEDTE